MLDSKPVNVNPIISLIDNYLKFPVPGVEKNKKH